MLLAATTGFTLSLHYCGTSLVSVSINSDAETCCDNDIASCCHIETKNFQIKEDYITSYSQYNFLNNLLKNVNLFPNILFNINLWIDLKDYHIFYNDSSPPPEIQRRLSLLQTYCC